MRRINEGSKSTSSLSLGSKTTPTKLDSIEKSSKKHGVSVSTNKNISSKAIIPSTLEEDTVPLTEQTTTSFSIMDLLKENNIKKESSSIGKSGLEGSEGGNVQVPLLSSIIKKKDQQSIVSPPKRIIEGEQLPLVENNPHNNTSSFSPEKKKKQVLSLLTEDFNMLEKDPYIDHLAPAENIDLFAYESALYHRVTGQYIPKQILDNDPIAQSKEIERIRQIPELYQAIQSITKLSKQFHVLAQDCLGHRKELGHALLSMEEKYLKLFENILSVSLKLYWHHVQKYTDKLNAEQKKNDELHQVLHIKEVQCDGLKKILFSKESLLKVKQIEIEDFENQLSILTNQIQELRHTQKENEELKEKNVFFEKILDEKNKNFEIFQQKMEEKIDFEKKRFLFYQEEQNLKKKKKKEEKQNKMFLYQKQLILVDQMKKKIQQQEKQIHTIWISQKKKQEQKSTQTIVHEEDGLWETKDGIPKYVSKHLVHRLMWKRFDAFVKCKNCHGRAIPKHFFTMMKTTNNNSRSSNNTTNPTTTTTTTTAVANTDNNTSIIPTSILQQQEQQEDNHTTTTTSTTTTTTKLKNNVSSIYREEDQDYIDFWSLEKRTIEKSINTKNKSTVNTKTKEKSTTSTITTSSTSAITTPSLTTLILIPKHFIKQQKEWFLPLSIRLFLSNLPRSVLAFPLFSLDQVISQIEEIYQDKFLSDEVDTQDGVATENMVPFVTEFFLKRCGVRQAAEISLYRFLISIKAHYSSHSHVKLFARFLELLQDKNENVEEKKEEKNKKKKQERITPLDRSHLRVFLHARHYLLSPSSSSSSSSFSSSSRPSHTKRQQHSEHEELHVIQVDPYKKWVPLEHTVNIIRWYLSFLPEQKIIEYLRQIEYNTAFFAGGAITEVTGNRLAVRAEMRKAMLPNDSSPMNVTKRNDAERPVGAPRILVDVHKALLLLMNAMEHRKEVMKQELLDMFAKGDANHDAVLSLEEFSQIIRFRVPNFSDRRILRMFREALMGGKDQSFALSMESFVQVCLDHGLVSLLPEELFGDPFQPKNALGSYPTNATCTSKTTGSTNCNTDNNTTAQDASKQPQQQQSSNSPYNSPSCKSIQYKGRSPSFLEVASALEAVSIRKSSKIGSALLLRTSIVLPKTRGKELGLISDEDEQEGEEDAIPEESGLVSHQDHVLEDEDQDSDVDEVEEEYGVWS